MANLLIDRHKVESKRLSSGWICFQKNKPLLNKLNEEGLHGSTCKFISKHQRRRIAQALLAGVAISEAPAMPPHEMKYLTPRVY